MDYELKERITRIRNDLALIWNVHQSEFTFYEGIKMSDAYYALVDMFDEKRAEEFNKVGEDEERKLKEYLRSF